MYATATKDNSTSHSRPQSSQPFFSKKGEGDFFAPAKEVAKPFFSPALIQPKLTINEPADQHEQEADAMADRVMRMGAPAGEGEGLAQTKPLSIQRKCPACEEKEEEKRPERGERDPPQTKTLSDWKTDVDQARKLFDDGKETESEQLFIQTLNKYGFGSFHPANGGIADTTKLKPGLNFDVQFGFNIGPKYQENDDANGFTSYRTASKGLTGGLLPIDIFSSEKIESVVVIGSKTMNSNLRESTHATIKHEEKHQEHHLVVIKHYEEWLSYLNKNKKVKDKILESIKKSKGQLSKNPNVDETMIKDLEYKTQANHFSEWVKNNKKIVPLERSLIYESVEPGRNFNSEVLSGLEGFIQTFHLIPLQDLNISSTLDFVFSGLTSYPVGLNNKGWKFVSDATKAEFEKLIVEYYCNKLDQDYKQKFDQACLSTEKNVSSTNEDKDFFKRIKNIGCNSKTKPKNKK